MEKKSAKNSIFMDKYKLVTVLTTVHADKNVSFRPSTFHILISSSETTGPIATKLWWNGPWMAPFQKCVR
jgi:hypothetical protein